LHDSGEKMIKDSEGLQNLRAAWRRERCLW